jgi:hypothetical protein
MSYKICTICNLNKDIVEFSKNRAQCKFCINKKKCDKYKNDKEYRKKCIEQSTKFKRKKIQLKKEKIIKEIGVDNKQCKYCNKIKYKTCFRYNRLKCKDCERDDPKDKFKRYVRTRIYNCLKRNKNKRSIEYLGCSNEEYYTYIMNYNDKYNIHNYGKIWHIDHVIPISLFDLSNNEEKMLAFNWRNTMPLDCKENLKKNNRIDSAQINNHYKKLKKYHEINNIIIPRIFYDLFAKHLDAGNSLEPQTTTSILETELKELG